MLPSYVFVGAIIAGVRDFPWFLGFILALLVPGLTYRLFVVRARVEVRANRFWLLLCFQVIGWATVIIINYIDKGL